MTESPLQPALDAALDALEGLDLRYAVVGGLAVGAWGVPRATKDVDLYGGARRRCAPALTTRALAARLERFGPTLSVMIWTPMPMPIRQGISMSTRCRIERIDHEASVVCVMSHHSEPFRCEIPVALIRAVWRTANAWNLAIEGSMLGTSGDHWVPFYPLIT